MSSRRVNSCVELLQAAVGFNTINAKISGRPDAELELALYLEAQAQGMGLATQRFPIAGESFNLMVSCRVSDAAPWLMFESHLDTVSTEGMRIDPFAGTIEAGRMYGRGACDTKSSGAAMLWALADYAKQSAAPNNVAILYTTDEEVSKTGIGSFVENHLPRLGWKPAGVIVGEPTGLKLVVAHNGVVRWTIRTHGVAAHSSEPAKGRSAISMMVKVIDALESRYIPGLTASHPLTGKAQCSINRIQGGVQDNIIPEACEIRIDRRVVPGEDPGRIVPAVRDLLDDLCRQDPSLHITHDDLYTDPPLDPAGNEPFARFIGQTLERMGLPAEPIGVAYGTDASGLTGTGVPAVVLGPGSIDQAHTCDEWIELDQLHRAVDVYRNIMLCPLEESG